MKTSKPIEACVIVTLINTDGEKVRLRTYASSLEDAERDVLQIRPGGETVVYSRTEKLTIEEIAEAVTETAPMYFDKETLAFWGQRLRSFKVKRFDNVRFLIEAPRKTGGVSRRLFNPFTNRLERVPVETPTETENKN
jgi:hypothetical protein